MAHNLDRDDDEESSVSAETSQDRSHTDVDRRTRLSRRSYVKCGVAVTALLPAITGGTAGSTVVKRDGIEFETVYDAVDDLDMDPTGEEPIEEAIATTGDRSLIEFPDGAYRFGAYPASVSLVGKTRGFEGIGDDVSFLAPSGKQEFLLDETELRQAYVASINIDQRGTDTCAGLRLFGDRVVVRNIDVIGGCDRRTGGLPLLSHATLSSGGSSLFENIVSTADSEIRPVLGRPGISLERAHSGRVSIRNCDLRGFPDPAIDGAGHSGSVLIADSYFENNASSIRIGNHESGIERCKIRVAELPAGAPTANGEQFHINGIAVAQDENRTRHQNNASSLTIADTTIRIDTVPNFCPAIVISSAGSPLILENVDIEFNNDGRAVILGRTPGAESQSGIRPLRMRDLSIVGEGIVDSAIVLKNTDSVRIHDSTLVMLNGNADGITIADSDGITIEETGVQVTDRALVATGTDGTIHQLSPDPDCSDRESTECGSGKFPDAVYQATVEQTEHSADKRFQLAGTLESLSIRGDTGVSFAKRNGKQ